MAKRQRTDAETSSTSDEGEEEQNNNKYFHVEPESKASKKPLMQCSLAPHSSPIAFYTFEDYEVHYSKEHSNRCSECHRNFPSNHFLQLHLGENHDPIRDARKARGEKTYECFVEDCDKVCYTPFKRRLHLVDKHMFPKNYDFFIVNDGLDPKRKGSMLRPAYRQKSKAEPDSSSMKELSKDLSEDSEEDKNEDENQDDDSDGGVPRALPLPKSPPSTVSTSSQPSDEVDKLANSMSALKFVPTSIRFGRGSRGGFARR